MDETEKLLSEVTQTQKNKYSVYSLASFLVEQPLGHQPPYTTRRPVINYESLT